MSRVPPPPPRRPYLRWPCLESVELCGCLERVHVAIHGGEHEVEAAVAVQIIGKNHAAGEERRGGVAVELDHQQAPCCRGGGTVREVIFP